MKKSKLKKKSVIIICGILAVVLAFGATGIYLWQSNVFTHWYNRTYLYDKAWSENPHEEKKLSVENVRVNGDKICLQIRNETGRDAEVVCKGNRTYTKTVRTGELFCEFDGLEEDTYEVRAYVKNGNKTVAKSKIRLVKTGFVEGTVISYLHPDDNAYAYSGQYLCSPSVVRMKDGTLFVSHDVFENGVGNQKLTRIFRSRDDGETWEHISDLYPCFWGKLFIVDDVLYMIATSTQYGDLLVGKSADGITWSKPTLLLKGGNKQKGGVHKAPNPVLTANGRLYCAVEYGSWDSGGHDAGFVTAPVDCDLLDAKNWTVSNFLPYSDETVENALSGENLGYLEGNPVLTRDGKLVNILRYNTGDADAYGKAVMLFCDTETNTVTKGKTIDFIGNNTKFDILYDEISGKYFSLVNKVTNGNPSQRNVLSLTCSDDLEEWKEVKEILNYDDNGYPENDKKVAFQYVDFIFVGEDIYFVSRTAMNGAEGYHDNNYITFHKIENFRELL